MIAVMITAIIRNGVSSDAYETKQSFKIYSQKSGCACIKYTLNANGEKKEIIFFRTKPNLSCLKIISKNTDAARIVGDIKLISISCRHPICIPQKLSVPSLAAMLTIKNLLPQEIRIAMI